MTIRFVVPFFCAALLGFAPTFAQSPPPVFPGATWTAKAPADVGLDRDMLDAVKRYLGGRGFITRGGYQVYTWGDYTTRGDVASAAKPWYAHFLYQAIADGKIPSLDTKVDLFEPRLDALNPELKFKDRGITFRQLANQISAYGVKEDPGTRFDYNDRQMALFWDTLFLKVYGASYDNIDAQVLHPKLTDRIQCEDSPTFMAFGAGNRPGRLAVSPRDFARFGLLYLRKGNWNGVQLLAEKTARMAVASPLPNSILRTGGEAAQLLPGQRTIGSTLIPDDQADHRGSYSWLWWINGVDRNGRRFWPDAPTDVYACLGHANGMRGMAVMPGQDIVISWNDTTLNLRPELPQPLNEVFRLLAKAVIPPPGPQPGQVVVDPANPRWFKFQDGSPFFLCGPGDPEGFLYRGTRNADGTRAGDQLQLIDKLKGTGANAIYLIAVRSHGGDGDPTQNPFVNSDPARGLDRRILDQWETWFTEMDRAGIVIFFVFYDDSARIWAGDTVGGPEHDFIRELVSRFKHHKNLIWCLAEESREAYSDERLKAIAAEIRAADDRRHPISVHLNVGLNFSAFADDPNIDQFAIQWNENLGLSLHDAAVKTWSDADGKFNLNMAEMYPSPERVEDRGGLSGGGWRRRSWAVAMGGAYSMHLFMDIAHTPVSDLQDCGRLVAFMQATNFNEMAPHDELAFSGTEHVLALPGDSYIAYASGLKADIGIKAMTSGNYSFKWFDCVSGAEVEQPNFAVLAGDQTWKKPAGVGTELAVLIRRIH